MQNHDQYRLTALLQTLDTIPALWPHRLEILLTAMGQKPVSSIQLIGTETIHEAHASIQSCFKSAGLDFQGMRTWPHFEHDYTYIVGRNPDDVEKMILKGLEDPAIGGVLYGYPQSAVDAYCKGTAFRQNVAELPLSLRHNRHIGFLDFHPSVANYAKEFAAVKRRAELVRATSSDLYAHQMHKHRKPVYA